MLRVLLLLLLLLLLDIIRSRHFVVAPILGGFAYNLFKKDRYIRNMVAFFSRRS